MGRILTNNTSLSVATEATVGTLPGSPTWEFVEPNTVGQFGSTITKVARNPISRNRQRRKGIVTDLDSAVDFEGDLTTSLFDLFIEGFMFANYLGEVDRDPSAVSGTDYTVDTGTVVEVNALVRGVGFLVTGNNGLHVVDGVPTTTSITATGLAIEAAPPATARVEVVGLEGPTGDIGVIESAGVISITSTVIDFTAFNLIPGQFIHIGGTATANRFFAAPDKNNSGFVRVVSVTATLMVVDKATETFVTDTGTGQSIQIFFGQFVKNVSTNDANFLERSYHMEMEYPGLAANGVDSKYEYAKGNFCNTMGITLPLTDKSTLSYGFIGTDTDKPTETRASEAENATDPIHTDGFGTATDCTRLRITKVDETGLTTDFKSATITIGNEISPEKALCNLGAVYMNYGNFLIDIEAQLMFTDSGVTDAIRDNETVTMDFGVKNEDGVIMFDIPSMTLGDGSHEFPVNETVLINVTCEAHEDPVLGNSLGVSKFPYVPTL